MYDINKGLYIFNYCIPGASEAKRGRVNYKDFEAKPKNLG